MAEEVTTPSGVQATLIETIYEPVGVVAASAKIMRLRFVAPAIVDQTRYDIGVLDKDFEWLCSTSGLPLAAKAAPQVEQIIVSIASEATDFGETAPNVVQYFDAFHVEDQTCIWEGL